jgi:hypothetical protein
MITPAAIEEVPDNKVKEALEKNGIKGATPEDINNFRSQARDKWGSLLVDVAHRTTNTLGVKGEAFVSGGMDPNSPMGAVMRLFTQFKGPAKMQADMLRSSYYSGGMPGIASHVGRMAFAGALVSYAYQLKEGKTLSDPRDPRFILEAMTRGPLGIYGDFLVNATRGTDRSSTTANIAKGLLGPTFSDLASVTNIAKEAITDKEYQYNARKDFSNWVAGSFPRTFYLQAPLNYFILNDFKYNWGHNNPYFLQRSMDQTPSLFGGQQKPLFDMMKPGASMWR